MQLGYRWLKELVDFDWDAEELCDRLTMAGVACEITRSVFEQFSGVVVGKVKAVEPHPNSNQLKICTVDIGLQTLTTVCGAPNVAVGIKSPFAAVGALLPGGVKIEPAKKQDIKSDGMLCSEKELGLSDEGSVIMELGPEVKAGHDLWERLNLDEPLIEFELTPNRPDCMSALGVAREIAALAGTKLKKSEFELKEIEKEAADFLKIEIDDSVACPRYDGRVIENVKIGPSPFWLKRKLVASGIRPINNVVDITNLVLMEYGQPLHAFDYDLFTDPRVVVRTAIEKEKFVTLDGEEHELKPEDILITDSNKAVALGGIMGGLDTEVSDQTKRILLESAYFNPTSICRTRKRLAMSSESSIRFEKGADPNIVGEACDYAAYLLSELAGGKVLTGRIECYPKEIKPVGIELRPARVNKILATDISSPTMIDILDSLGFGVKSGKKIMVKVPTFRPDCTREIDLIEEIGRIFGYDKIGTSVQAGGMLLTERRMEELLNDKIRENLTRQGLYEILTINMIDPEKGRKIGVENQYVELLNPLSSDLAAYRTDLLISMLQVVSRNLNRRQKDLKLFELGNVAYKENSGSHVEESRLAITVCGRPESKNWSWQPEDYDFFDLKGILQDFSSHLSLDNLRFEQKEYPWFIKDLSFNVFLGKVCIGYAGEVTNKARDLYDIEIPVFYMEIKVDELLKLYNMEIVFKPLPRYPSVWRDIAVIVDDRLLSEKLLSTIYTSGGELLVNAELFDVYTGKQIEKGKKSLAFNLEFRSDDKTLTDEEVEPVFNNIISQLKNNYDSKLRT
jgi:phenylalanyl-tRNA synthetase beta chain